jgi:hypothetical protein
VSEQGAPDAFVRTALQLLPVPDHGESFWTELDALLDAEPPHLVDEPALAVGPTATRVASPLLTVATRHAEDDAFELVPDGSQRLVPRALRRRSNAVLTAVAVAAALMVVVAGTNLVRQRADTVGTTELADSTDDTKGEVISSTSSSIATIVGRDAEVPTDAVMAWVAALATGDTESAWASMGPASQAHFGSQSAFVAEGARLAEGYGAWSAATPDDVIVTPVISGDDGAMVVVTLVGEVSQEGTMQQRADAFPVRMVDGAAQVEPFAFAGELEIVVPEPVPADGKRPVVSSDDALVVVVPRGVDAPTIRLDDGETLVCGESAGTELTELDGAPGQRCSYHPDGGIPAGKRVLTVAFLSPDGSGISAESVLFEAA